MTDGDLAIDNNASEREMKYVTMGKKAWLFYGSDRGGRDHAIVLSILSTCRRHDVEPLAYLTDVIQRLTENPAENPENLLPYNWKRKTLETKIAEIRPCWVLQKPPKLHSNLESGTTCHFSNSGDETLLSATGKYS